MIRSAVIAAALAAALAACSSDSSEGAATGGAGGGAFGAPLSEVERSRLQEDLASFAAGRNGERGDRVLFGLDSSSLSPEARQILTKQAEWLKRNGNARFQIEGHADERGTREYNLALGERRGNAARDYLVAQGIQQGRLNVTSYGKERPEVLGSTELAFNQNRRAVSLVR